MDELSCAAEGCDALATGRLRFNDVADNPKCPPQAHLGGGLVLRVDLCDDHLSLCRGRGADIHRWQEVPNGG